MEDGKALRLAGILWSCPGNCASVLTELEVEPQLESGHGRLWGGGGILQPKDPALARLDAISPFPSLGSEASWLGLQGIEALEIGLL